MSEGLEDFDGTLDEWVRKSSRTLKNVTVGKNQYEGVHSIGPCVIQNVWWEDVCQGNGHQALMFASTDWADWAD